MAEEMGRAPLSPPKPEPVPPTEEEEAAAEEEPKKKVAPIPSE